MLYGNPRNELCVWTMYGILAVIGLGSAGLHSTLHWLPQSSDEIPMLWLALADVYMLWINRYGRKKEDKVVARVGYAFLGLAIVQTVVYYSFQHFYIVFLASITLYIVTIAVWLRATLNASNPEWSKMRLFLTQRSDMFLLVLAIPIWLFDMTMCSYLVPFYTKIFGITLHVVWHILAGLGAYYTSTNLVLIHCQESKIPVKIGWIGLLPVCILHNSSNSRHAIT